MDRNSDGLQEVHLLNALETTHDPRSVPLEVSTSDAPELDHDPQAFPPEVVFSQGPVCVNETSIQEAGNEENNTAKRHTITVSFDWIYVKWRWITLLMVTLCIGGIAGGIGGGIQHKKKHSPVVSPTISPVVPATTTAPPSIISRTLLPNTSITAASCPSGDRWIFLQESNGNITAAQYLFSASTWAITSGYNFSNARIGTALSASCIEMTYPPAEVGSTFYNSGFNFSLLISLVYLNGSNAIQQSIYDNKTWMDSPVWSASSPPENNTKLSISTIITNLQNSAYRPSFYSVVTYESGLSFIMIDLDPYYNDLRQPRISENRLLWFNVPAHSYPFEALYTDIGFACIYNAQAPDNPQNFFTACYFQLFPPPNSQILNFIWEYPSSAIYGNQTINSTAIIANSDTSPIASVNADILIVPLLGNQSALIYLNLNNTVGISVGDTYNGDSNFPNNPGKQGVSSSSAITFPHIAATSMGANSTDPIIYTYYQLNNTAIAELTYNTANKTWGSEPTIISFMEFFNASGGYING